MIPGATPARTFRFTDDLTELVRSSNVTGGGKITTDGGILTTDSPGSDDRAYAYFNVYLPRGSVIEISCEARQMTSTSQGRIGIDQHESDGKVGGGNVDYVQMEDTQWKPQKLTKAGDHKKPFTSVTFGVWLAQVGKAQFRNIVITIYNVMAPSPDYRTCMLKGTEGVWTIDDGPGRFTNIGCYGIVVEDDHIRINWSPLHSWQRPIVTVQMDQAGGRAFYQAQISGAEKRFVRVYIMRDGVQLKPKDVPGTMFVGMTAIAI